jgi:hypothetical protein
MRFNSFVPMRTNSPDTQKMIYSNSNTRLLPVAFRESERERKGGACK